VTAVDESRTGLAPPFPEQLVDNGRVSALGSRGVGESSSLANSGLVGAADSPPRSRPGGAPIHRIASLAERMRRPCRIHHWLHLRAQALDLTWGPGPVPHTCFAKVRDQSAVEPEVLGVVVQLLTGWRSRLA
jgi:hypothetical protein